MVLWIDYSAGFYISHLEMEYWNLIDTESSHVKRVVSKPALAITD